MFEEALSLCEKVVLTSAIPLETCKHKAKTAAFSANERTLLQTKEKRAQKSFTATNLSSGLHSTQNLFPGLVNSGSGLGTRLPNKARVLSYSRHFTTLDSSDKRSFGGKEESESQLFTSLNSTPSTGSGYAWMAVLGYGKYLF